MNVAKKALRMLEKYPLCDHCLGRQFALLGHGLENNERGKCLKMILALDAHKLSFSKREEGRSILTVLANKGSSKGAMRILDGYPGRISTSFVSQNCFLCKGIFSDLQTLSERSIEELDNYEYSTFLVGIRLPVEFEERDDEFKSEFEVKHGENMRNEIGRTLGKKICEITGKTVDYTQPDIVVLINPVREEIRLQVNPLYISGRYRKLVKGIPQSPWVCPNCGGKGCKECGMTGRMYSESVAELIEKPFLEETEGTGSVFHASGREAVDARMLGRGRPFVVEIKNPRKRFFDLKELEETVNAYVDGKVEVLNLKITNKEEVRKQMEAEFSQKEYLVTIKFENNLRPGDLKLLREKLTDVLVRQRIPRRVLNKGPDLLREKYIYSVKLKKLSDKKIEMKIRCQGGLRVKELVTGNGGRTHPNVSQIIKNKAKPITLDVLNLL